MRVRWPILLLVAGHTALLASYTLPAAWIPAPLSALAAAYVRPLFHQQWRLFAPDPPRCSCRVEVEATGPRWVALRADRSHYLHRRIVHGIAWNVQRAVHNGGTTLEPIIAEAIARQAHQQGLAMGPLRLVEQCVTDPNRPSLRTQRITSLHQP
jgi:hypothetical protein